MKLKEVLTVDMLQNSHAKCIGTIKLGELHLLKGVDHTNIGFYFITKNNKVYSRYYIGRQRSKCGFNDTVRKIKKGRSKNCLIIRELEAEVFFISLEDIKHLTTARNKNKFTAFFTKTHEDKYQNLEEINRMLCDYYTFVVQKY